MTIKTGYVENESIAAAQNIKERDYWLEKLSGEPVKSMFPYDFNRPPAGDVSRESVSFRFPGELFDKLDRLSNGSDIRMFIIMVSSLSVLLYKYQMEEDAGVIVGAPIYKQEIEGDFINTVLALKTQPRESMTFKEMLLHVANTVSEAADHQNYPIERLLYQLNLEASDDSFPLFDIAVLHEKIHDGSYLEHIPTSMTFIFNTAADYLEGRVEYNPVRYERSTVERIARYLQELIQSAVENLDITIGELGLPFSGEDERLLQALNREDVEYPREDSIQSLFAAQVEKTPDAPALVYEKDSITYRELDRRAKEIAAVLANRGVGPNDIVAIMTEPSFHMVAGMLGILQAGGAYLPLDTEYPAERIAFMLEDSNASILLTAGNLQLPETLAETSQKREIIHIDRLEDTSADASIPPLPAGSADDLAYIIYTSGTTGKPKGVMIRNRSVVRLLENEQFPFDFSSEDTWTMFHSYCFDFSVWEMYGALLKGGKLVLVPKMVARDTGSFLQLVRENGVTVLNQTPSAFYNFMNEESAQPGKDLQVRCVIFGGESLSPGKLVQWRERYPETRLINMFGITETTVHVTIKEITEYEIENNINSVGIPIPTLSAYVLDNRGKRRPIGIAGQLYVGGAGVAAGYLNRPQLTAEKFVDNPFDPGNVYYASGDLARIDSGGEIIYMGRIDHQVQLRGFRIELEEIENQLLKVEGVNGSVVVAGTDRDGDDYICAYLVADNPISLSILRDSLSASLPLYMVPKYFVFIDRIPLTPNGKVDRKALPKPEISSEEEYVAPTDETEKIVADTWARVLDLERVGIKDNYFNIGGDSIKAVKLLGALNDTLDTELTIPDLYQNDTVEELAHRIKELSSEGTGGRREDMANAVKELDELKKRVAAKHDIPENIEDFYPMSDIEKGMVFASLINPEEAVYHDQFVFQVKLPGFDPDIFDRAFLQIIEKHPILRTCFDIENYEENLQFVHKTITPAISHFDISSKDKPEQEAYLNDRLAAGRKEPFDLSSPPLWRMRTFITGKEGVLLTWEFHHAIIDGWSNAALISELVDTYMKLKTDPGYRLTPLNRSYKDFVIEQAALKSRPQTMEFWKEELSGYEKLDLSLLASPDACGTGRGDYGYEIAPALYRQLQQVAVNRRTSVKHLLFGAYLRLISVLSGNDEIVMGIVTNTRPLCEEGDKILGCFLNSIPVRFETPAGITYGEYVKAIEDKMVELKPYEGVSLFEIARNTGEKVDERNPIFNILYNYVDFHVYDLESLGNVGYRLDEERELEVSGHESSGFDWGLNVSATFGKLIVDFSYDRAVIGEDTARRWAGYFDRILQMIIRDSIVMRADDLPGEEEKQRLLEEFNNTAVPRPDNAVIHQLFLKQVEKNPDHPALAIEDQRLTYRQLDDRANRVAGLLHSRGIGKNAVVPLIVETSFDMVAGILGILKSGAAYLPIDPAYPEERIKYILQDSGATVTVAGDTGTGNLEDTIETIYISGDETGAESSLPEVAPDPGSPAYAIYTSGTTGKPKGVLVEHRGVVNYSLWRIDAYEYTQNDVTLQLLSYSFDGFVSNFYSSLLSGGTLVLVPDGKKADYEYIAHTVKEHRVTNTSLVPGMYEALLDNAEDGDIASLRFVVLAGETAGERLILKSREKNPELRHIIEYGPTEATVTALANLDIQPSKTAVIGKPIANSAVYILDTGLHPVPIGVPGEIVIGGAGVSRGYINHPEQTSGVFVDNPYSTPDTPPAHLYRTGDMARRLPDGTIQFMGRKDLQVKIRGFRIELKEIERQLTDHPRISDAVVTAPDGKDGEKYLCAYIVLKKDPEAGARNFLPAGKLKRFLGAQLPKYMVPSYFIQLDAIPLTRNGKVDVKALPVPETAVVQVVEKAGYCAPTDPIEEKMVEVWADLLGLEKETIGIDSVFFDIGGHSLKATTLASRIRKEFGTGLPLGEVFKTPTVRGLSDYIKQASAEGPGTETADIEMPAIEAVEKREFYRMSSAQERLYFMYRMDPGSVGYNMPRILLVDGDMELERMEAAMKALVQRHEALRTSFRSIDKTPVQRIHDTASFEIDYYDAGNGENAAVKLAPGVEKRVASFIKPFDLSEPPLLRMALIKRAERKFVWMIDLHHIISDKVTQEILIKDFMALYGGKELEPLTLQYKDFSQWRQHHGTSSAMEAQAAYWVGQFEDNVPQLQLPTDYSRPAAMTLAGDMVTGTLDEEQNKKIKEFTRETGSTLYMLMLAVFNLLMAKSSGQEDLVVGSPIAGRRSLEMEAMAGVFVNMLAMRNRPAGDKTFMEFLEEVRENSLKAFENQDFQFPDLVKQLGLERTKNRNPLFNVVFQSDILKGDDLDFGDLKVVSYEDDAGTRSQFDLIMGATETDGSIFIQLTYSTELFKQETAREMLRRYVEILDQVVADRNIKIKDITLSHGLLTSRSESFSSDQGDFGF